jgi:hypothetical protein
VAKPNRGSSKTKTTLKSLGVYIVASVVGNSRMLSL